MDGPRDDGNALSGSAGTSAPGWAAPVRACLAGENLDWIGFSSVCAAVDLPTQAQLAQPGASPYEGPLLDLVWRHICNSPGSSLGPPPQLAIGQSAPTASGLATSSALVMCLLQLTRESCGAEAFSREEVIETAYELERLEANGGGMDQLCIGHGGAFLLQGRSDGLPNVVDRVPWPDDWCFVIVDSGIRKHSPTHIAEVRRRLRVGDPTLRRYVEIADECAVEMWSAIRDANLAEIKALLDHAHGAMRDHQRTSTAQLERLRAVARDCGCHGLKLSGAGGGGALFTISTAQEAPGIASELELALRAEKKSAARVISARADNRGIRRLR